MKNPGIAATWARIHSQIDAGSVRGLFIYMHYTNAAGFQAISIAREINGLRAGELRSGAASDIYLSPSNQRFSPVEVWQNLLLAEARYRDRGDYVFILALKTNRVLERVAVSHGSPYVEIRYPGAIKFRTDTAGNPANEGDALVLYQGRNRF